MEEDKKYFGKNALAHLKLLIEKAFQKKEFKTGSESEYKVLSDNNLTDELVQKINEAGNSKFSGAYNDLTGIPTLDGTELKGTLTKDDLGIAAKTDIPTNNNQLTNGAGYQTAKDVEGIINGKGYQTEDDVETAITEKGYQTASDVEGIVNAKVASVYKYKGSVASYADLSEKEKTAEEGDVWNTEDTEQNYAWTGSKWDPLGATFNSSEFVKNKDLTELSNDEIDAIFNS